MSDARILFVGAGATGGYFGGRLAQAGHDVTFLVRAKRAAQLAERGLRIVRGDTVDTIAAATITAEELARPYDVIVVAVKAFALEPAIDDFAPAVGSESVVVPLLNGMSHLDKLTARFGPRSVFGGVCLVATTLDGEGDVIALNDMHRLAYGPLDEQPSERLDTVAAALSGASFPSVASLTITHDMWEKWMVLAGLGAITCLMRGTVGEVNSAPGGAAFTQGVIDEVTAIATAAGYPPRDGFAATMRESLTSTTAPTTSSMYRDLTGGAPVEADAIVGDLVAAGRSFGTPTPLFELAYTNLAVYQTRRG